MLNQQNPQIFTLIQGYTLALRVLNYKKIYTKSHPIGWLCLFFLGDPLGARTQDPNIKSVVLYQLS